MTINEVIEKVNRLCPGAVEDRDIASWILQLDEKLFLELQMPSMVPISTYPDLLPDNGDQEAPEIQPGTTQIPATELLVEFRRPKEWPRDGDMELVAKSPYDNLYVLYAQLWIEFYRKDYEEYNNTALEYNNAVTEFRKSYRRAHAPEPVYIQV